MQTCIIMVDISSARVLRRNTVDSILTQQGRNNPVTPEFQNHSDSTATNVLKKSPYIAVTLL